MPSEERKALAFARAATVRAIGSAKGFRLLVRVGDPDEEMLHVAGREKGIGMVVLECSEEGRGKRAYEILRQNRAAVAIVPSPRVRGQRCPR